MRRGLSRHNNRSSGSVVAAFSPLSLFSGGAQGVWYDDSLTSSMFQDSAGTTAAALESPVGSQLDLRNTAYSVVFNGTSDYLTLDGSAGFAFGTGDFTIEGWFYFANVNPAQMLIDFRPASGNGSYPAIYIDNTGRISFYTNTADVIISAHGMSAGSWYHIALSKVSGNTKIFVGGVQKGSTYVDTNNYIVGASRPSISVNGYFGSTQYINGNISNLRVVKGTGLYSANFTPPTAPLTAISGTSLLTCGNIWTGNPTITVVSTAKVSQLSPFVTGTGNHRYQATSANRPTLSARYNLLTKTEDLTVSPWVKALGITSATAVAAPDGTNTAFSILCAIGVQPHQFYQQSSISSTQITNTITAKAGTASWLGLGFDANPGTDGAYFNLATGQVGTVASGTTATIVQSAYAGWYICTVTRTFTSGTHYATVEPHTADNQSYNYLAAGNETILVWHPDQRPANQATGLIPTYQRVDTSSVYDTVGFPQYLKYNGSNSSLSTASINFTATAQMSVFSGVRKLVDATYPTIFEFSANSDSNNGAFLLTASQTVSLPYYFYQSRGTASASRFSSSYVAPITNVVTGLSNITAPSVTVRVNGSDIQTSPSTQGTGNYGNYPLYFGARAGSGLFFNGYEYQTIIVGKTLTATEIANTETYVNSKTKAY